MIGEIDLPQCVLRLSLFPALLSHGLWPESRVSSQRLVSCTAWPPFSILPQRHSSCRTFMRQTITTGAGMIALDLNYPTRAKANVSYSCYNIYDQYIQVHMPHYLAKSTVCPILSSYEQSRNIHLPQLCEVASLARAWASHHPLILGCHVL